MRIVTPCDWKVVDLLKTENANDFGEALRSLTFIGTGQQTGCYSTFQVSENFIQVKKGKIFEEAKKHLWEDIRPTIYHYKINEISGKIKKKRMEMFEPYEIVCGWTWDGDGCLYFRFNDRKVVNTDCKKDYTWDWIK